MNSFTELSNFLSDLQKRNLPTKLGGKNIFEQAESLQTYEEINALIESMHHNSLLLTKENCTPLITFLQNRWQRIQLSDSSYCFNPHAPMNQICWHLAEELAKITHQPAIKLLIPNLDLEEDVTGQDMDALKPWQFVLSDDVAHPRPIIVADALGYAQEDGIFKHTSLFTGETRRLSPSERERVIKHSPEATALYQAIVLKREIFETDSSMLGHLERFIEQLRAGGAHGGRGGEELNAGNDANVGIAEFAEYVEKLTPDRKEQLFKLAAPQFPATTIGVIWERLRNPTAPQYQGFNYCVEVNASELSTIVSSPECRKRLEPQCSREEITQRVQHCEQKLKEVIEGQRTYQPEITYGLSSRDVLCQQLMKNDHINQLTKKYPHLSVALHLAAHQQNKGTLLSNAEHESFKIWTQATCPALKSLITTLSELRFQLQQLSAQEQAQLLAQLDEQALKKLVPNTEELIKLLRNNEDDFLLSSDSKIAICNAFIAKKYFKETFHSYREFMLILFNCDISRAKCHLLNIKDYLSNCKEQASLEDLLTILQRFKENNDRAQIMRSLGQEFLTRLVKCSPAVLIREYRDLIVSLKLDTPAKLAWLEKQEISAQLLSYQANSQLHHSKQIISDLIKFAQGQLSSLPAESEELFKNHELHDLYTRLKKLKPSSTMKRYLEPNATDYDYIFKFALFGAANSGKSNLLLRYHEDVFVPYRVPYTGVDFKISSYQQENKEIIKVQSWDLPSFEHSRTLNIGRMLRGAKAFIVTADLSDPSCLGTLKEYLRELDMYIDSPVVVIAGTKSDIASSAVADEITAFAQEKQYAFIKTSALDNEGVEEVFLTATELAWKKMHPAPSTPEPTEPNHRTGHGGRINRFFANLFPHFNTETENQNDFNHHTRQP